ncbi:MAG: hypothetical protein IJS67_00070, partial [Clostridia bacterium]|nr:hypothetical protein [Clostridia bacterium]
MKWIKSKIIALALAVAGVLYFTNDFGLIDIEKTAIVVALGIDYEKESEDYSVTAQIAVPQGSNGAAIENNEISVCGNGKTIAEAIDAIGISSGWYPLLSFCRLVLVGEGLLSEDIVDTLNYFIRSDKVPDSALIAACEKEAKEILQSKTPLGKATSMAIETILVKDIAKTNAIAVINTKNFIQNYYSRSQSGFMPLIKLKKAQNSESPQGSEGSSGISDGSGGAGDSSGNLESGGQKEEFVFDTDNTLLFSRGKKVATLDKEQTL